MEKIIDYFTHIPPAHRSLLLIGGIAFFWIVESIIPLFSFNYNKIKHAGTNIFFTFTTVVINFLLAYFLVKGSDWATAHHFGLLNWLPQMSIIIYTILGLLFLDLIGAYFAHWVQHKVKWMWRFHLIHHTDTYIDTTSANRHHPGESIIRFVFTAFGVFLIGAPMWLFFIYQTMSLLLSQFIHANIVLPKWLDNAIGWVFVSPDMHKVHHHYMLPYTDSNYGNIFSLWDRLFGTLMVVDDIKKLTYGIDTHMKPEENEPIGSLLKIPFGEYRSPNGSKFI